MCICIVVIPSGTSFSVKISKELLFDKATADIWVANKYRKFIYRHDNVYNRILQLLHLSPNDKLTDRQVIDGLDTWLHSNYVSEYWNGLNIDITPFDCDYTVYFLD